MLNIEFTGSVSWEFRGFELVLCLGCPNVYLSRHVSQSEAFVRGFWGGDSVGVPLGVVESVFCGIIWRNWWIVWDE